MPYVVVSEPKPFDTVLLNYNWQIWNTQAFSLYTGTTEVIDPQAAETSLLSPADATVFLLRHKSICFQQTLLLRLVAAQGG